MANIFFDFSGGSSVEKSLKNIQNSMEKVSKKVNKAYGELSSNTEMTNAFSSGLLNEISQAAGRVKDQSALMGQYASIMHDVQAEYMELDSQKSKTKGSGFLGKIKATWNALKDSFTSTFSMAFLGLIAAISGGHSTKVVVPDNGSDANKVVAEVERTDVPKEEVMECPEPSPYETYRSKVDRINSNGNHFQEQLYRLNPDGSKATGICQISASTMILNRRKALDGKGGNDFSAADVLRSKGYKGNADNLTTMKGSPNKHGYITSIGTVINGRETVSNGGNTAEYKLGHANIGSQSIAAQQSSIREYLDSHPEGICVRLNNQHWITLTDYEEIDGKVQLYAMDPENCFYSNLPNARCTIEETRAKARFFTDGDIYGHISEIIYVKN